MGFFFSLSLSEKIFENTQYLHSVTFLAAQRIASSNVVDDNVHNEQALQLEITTYLGPVAVTEEDKLSPLKFWKRNAKVYPHRSLIARIFLTPSASVPVESLFSISGLIKTTRRSSLAPSWEVKMNLLQCRSE